MDPTGVLTEGQRAYLVKIARKILHTYGTPMSVKVTAFAQGVAAEYGDLSNKVIYPGAGTVKKLLKISDTTVRTHFGRAVEMSLLTMLRPPIRRKDGTYEPGHYQVNFDWIDLPTDVEETEDVWTAPGWDDV